MNNVGGGGKVGGVWPQWAVPGCGRDDVIVKV